MPKKFINEKLGAFGRKLFVVPDRKYVVVDLTLRFCISVTVNKEVS